MIVIALGSNLPSDFGAPPETLQAAIPAISAHGIVVTAQSSLWRTEPIPPDPEQDWFYNQVVSVETDHDPQTLLAILLRIEQDFGRKRSVKNAARILDLDLIAYHDTILEGDDLQLPHPRMSERLFVLQPLHEISPDWVHPMTGEGVGALIKKLDGSQKLEPL